MTRDRGLEPTLPPEIDNPAAASPTKLAESRLLLKIALPLVAAYLAEFAMFITTKIVVGELGYRELAATGLAGSLAFEVLVVIMGLLSIVGVLVAHAEGGGRKEEAGHATRQGLIVATALGPACDPAGLEFRTGVILDRSGPCRHHAGRTPTSRRFQASSYRRFGFPSCAASSPPWRGPVRSW